MSVGEDVEKKEPMYTIGENVNWCGHHEKQYGGLFFFFLTLSILKETTKQSSNSPSWYLPQENKNTNSKRCTHSYVYCSIIYNSQCMEAT